MPDEFVKVARLNDLAPGHMMRVEAHDDRILVANVDNNIYAICDTCSHEDASLYMGALHGEHVRCPLHGSRFSLKTGEPLEEPAYEPVAVYPVRVEDGFIWIGPRGYK